MPIEAEVSVMVGSDYAQLTVGDTEFYYGYELGWRDGEEIWGFIAKRGGHEITRIEHREMREAVGCPGDREDSERNLLFGIGLFMARTTK